VRLVYFDCFSGISGDMALGALVHAGADLKAISATISTLPIEPFLLDKEDVEVQGIAATRIHLRTRPTDVIRTYGAIRSMLEEAELPPGARRVAQRAFRRLAEAIATLQQREPDLVTFSEYGELDSLVEVVACALALDQLSAERVFASPVPTGLGMARTEHGIMPIPSPVVMELLRGVPTYSRGIPVELVSATGAAILAAVAEGYGDMPVMLTDRVGYGAGHLRLDFPNVLRVVIGEERRMGFGGTAGQEGPGRSMGLLVEATSDALPDDELDGVLARLLEAGAAEAWAAPVRGPGGAPRTIVSAATAEGSYDAVSGALSALPGAGPVRTSPVAFGITERPATAPTRLDGGPDQAS
jgi:pyridinium-3,5-bisthiocarboxylic acid mononucleotide nickel chelatase